MARLLQLPDGRFSLEYEFEEEAAVRRALHSLDPSYSVKRYVSDAKLTVRGADLLADSDPLGACLISFTPEGDEILGRIKEKVDDTDVRKGPAG